MCLYVRKVRTSNVGAPFYQNSVGLGGREAEVGSLELRLGKLSCVNFHSNTLLDKERVRISK